jgi:flagellar basal-body rod protein FlgF
MDKLAYTALAAMQNQSVVRAAITNELANVSTVGFKKSFEIASSAVKIEVQVLRHAFSQAYRSKM